MKKDAPVYFTPIRYTLHPLNDPFVEESKRPRQGDKFNKRRLKGWQKGLKK